MAFTLETGDLKKLKYFIDYALENPTFLNMPQLQFVKDFVEKFGGTVPPGQFNGGSAGGKCPFGGDAGAKANEPANASVDSEDEKSLSDPESDVELDMEGVIEADSDPAQPMGNYSKKATEEEVEQASELRAQAASAYGEQKFDEAIALYTKAIELSPGNALFHAKRGQAFLKLKKPNACIRDCDMALELNSDLAAGYKFRGRARRLLGDFELAAHDLRQACKLDFDEEIDEWLKEVTPNAKKIEQHRVKQERRQAERKIEERQRDQRRARKEQEKHNASSGGSSGEFSPGAPGNVNISDILGVMKDPEVSAAIQDILSNPGNITKYASNPKIYNLIKKIVPGGDVGAAFGQAGEKAGEPSEPKPKKDSADFVDDGLD
ncbi:GM12305 [Drosophila sechellia]|uniref:GM12305 n=1 Tax=Drosophila sechellia TaxID=7238 RepID=B4I152_DROSE|nr:GM12305 [Drosophila sechellia]